MTKNIHNTLYDRVKLFMRRSAAFVLMTVQLWFAALCPCCMTAFAEETVLPDAAVTPGDVITDSVPEEEERFFFYGNDKTDFVLDGKFISASFTVSEKGVKIIGIKNTSSDFEWISGDSFAELSEVYYDEVSAVHNFDWEYFGCRESESGEKLIFEFKSKDGKFSSAQEWCIGRSDTDGAVIFMTYSVKSDSSGKIRLPERFTGVSLQLSSEEGCNVEYLDGKIKDETVSEKDVITFTAGNDGHFDMSVPLFYFNADGEHGIALGMGVYSPDKVSLMNVAVSDKSMVCNTDANCQVTEEGGSTVYSFPAFFAAVFDGNNSVGKNFIKNWSISGQADTYGSLPVTYENVVGTLEINNVRDIRESFYNMMFYFSVSDAKKNTCSTIKDELALCQPEHSAAYNYILRSAVFCDFDYTKVGLEDGTALKKSAAEHDELYRNRLASVMLNGRQYPVFPGYTSDGWDGIEFYDSVNKKGTVFIFRDSVECEVQRAIAIQGVIPDIDYKVSSLDGSVSIEKISGAELLSGGLTVSLLGDALSDIIFIEEAEVDFADVKILLFGNELSSLEIIAIAAILLLAIGLVITAIIVNAQDEYREKKF